MNVKSAANVQPEIALRDVDVFLTNSSGGIDPAVRGQLVKLRDALQKGSSGK